MYIREVLFWGEETMSHASLEDTPQLLWLQHGYPTMVSYRIPLWHHNT
jgi:hypothetical protein